MSELVRLLESMRASCGPDDGQVNTEDLNRAINLAKLQGSQEQAAAGALQAAARLWDRMVKLGNTGMDQLTPRQHEEYNKFASYAQPGIPFFPGEHFDVARWLRDLSAKTSQITPAREYGVATRHQGYKKWLYPQMKGETGTLRDARQELESLQEHTAIRTGVTEAKIVSRTKAGDWEDQA